MAMGLFRMMASLARDMVIANTFGSASLLIIFLLGGFIIPKGAELSIFNPQLMIQASFFSLVV